MIEFLVPEAISPLAAGALVVASFFTSALTAAAGIGGGLLMLALMTYLLPVAAIIPVHGMVQLGSNTSRSWVQRENINWPIARIFLLGSIVGAIVGIMLFTQLPEGMLEGILGAFILLVVWAKFPPIKNPGAGIVASGGIATTFVSMFVGATGPLVAVFLKHLFERHREMVATHGATMVGQHGVKVAAFLFAGFAFQQWIGLIVAMVISGFLGVKAGTLAMNRLPEKTLKFLFKTVLTLVALDLLRRGVQAFLVT